MSNTNIPLDEAYPVLDQINLSSKLEKLLNDFSQWCSDQEEEWSEDFTDHMDGTQEGTLYEFLLQNNIGIRPSWFEFYLIEEGSGNTGIDSCHEPHEVEVQK